MKEFPINKGINAAIEFRGLKAQFIVYLVAVVVGSLVGFGLMHVAGVSTYVSAPSALGLGGFGMARVFALSRKYGQYGLMKRAARKKVPGALLSRSRVLFIHL